MAKTIIGSISSYKEITQSDWMWHQTPDAFGEWKNIQIMAQAAKPDFLLLYNFCDFVKPKPQKTNILAKLQKFCPKQQIKQKEQEEYIQTLLRGVPKERIISLVREPPFPELEKKRVAEYEQARKYCAYVSGPDDFAPIPGYMPAIWYHANSFRELNEMPPPKKVRPCSWITSGIDRTANHKHRLAFLKMLRERNFIFDVYGRNLPDWANSGGQVNNKWHCMAPYYYNLAIENYADNNWYVSEKLWDAILAWNLPIYYGGSAADELLPPGSFLRLPSMDEKGLAYIKEVTATPDAWYEAKDAIAEARQIILHELNLLNWISNFVKKQG
ncbi:glycosyltransferase family 10 domain-containing protein [Calothrix sp. UHCC 0171]|uniref:glycosyltransferase family 10 domain-containing protein n=1 Tax=Calothrix sp. UHCC 0171 TaxID=3110245 RepID=UPI002B2009D5|nr:glycosyltransferase family 10 [Calothrix sp. UHCC 0171]MEA5571675.1 glycosyltransferase family 10 [Calothrix sp. UHCC 0171]